MKLNNGQQLVADEFFKFLLSNDKEMIISGSGGYGKTYLMGHLIDKIIPQYHEACKLLSLPVKYSEVVMVATTNKAAANLQLATGRPTETLCSFLNLFVREDYDTGRTSLSKNTKKWVVHCNKIIFIDEAYTADSAQLRFLDDGTLDCKIVYVGDEYQTLPVMESVSPLTRLNIAKYSLTEPVRNSEQPELQNICDQMRETVRTGEFEPIRIVPGVIDLLDDTQMGEAIAATFTQQNDNSRILAYSNNRVIEYNEHIRELRNLPPAFTQGEHLVCNSAYRPSQTSPGFIVEEPVIITSASEEVVDYTLYDGTAIPSRVVTLRSALLSHVTAYIPLDRMYVKKLSKWYAQQKKWQLYFALQNAFPDLRQPDAGTTHKAQGSTYESVFIDLTDISSCKNPDTAARILYVAVSRPTTRIFLYGTLAAKYGGVIT